MGHGEICKSPLRVRVRCGDSEVAIRGPRQSHRARTATVVHSCIVLSLSGGVNWSQHSPAHRLELRIMRARPAPRMSYLVGFGKAAFRLARRSRPYLSFSESANVPCNTGDIPTLQDQRGACLGVSAGMGAHYGRAVKAPTVVLRVLNDANIC